MSYAGNSRARWRIFVLATIAFFIFAGIWFIAIPVKKSKGLEQSLIDKFGWTYAYTPPAAGFIPAERLERFVRVRKAVQDNCAIFQGILNDILKLETIEADQDMPAGEKASESMESFKSMFSAAPAFLEFMDARNQALLTEEMGLGEYTHIYLAAYGPQLAAESTSKFSGQDEAYISARTRSEYARILGNQVVALEASGEAASEQIAGLQTEITVLKDSQASSPWANGPPAVTRESLAPFREKLNELYCDGIVKIELLQKNRGLNFGG